MYIRDFDRIAGNTGTADELYEQMLWLYPDRINPGSLWSSARGEGVIDRRTSASRSSTMIDCQVMHGELQSLSISWISRVGRNQLASIISIIRGGLEELARNRKNMA